MTDKMKGLDFNDLIEEYAFGKSVLQISKEHGIPHHRIYTHFVGLGVPMCDRGMDPRDVKHFVDRWRSGIPVKQIAKETGIKPKRLYRAFAEAGIHVGARKRSIPELDALIMAYVNGASEKSLADKYDLTRGTIRNRLLKAGINPRGRSESNRVKWAKVKGSPTALRSWSAGMATARQRLLSQRGIGEDEVAGALRELGFPIVQQKACGPYNVDIAIEIPAIAIEIVSGGGKPFGAGLRKRTKYILDAGWRLIHIGLGSGKRRRFCIGPLADQLVAILEQSCGDESTIGKYWVLSGDGKIISGPRS